MYVVGQYPRFLKGHMGFTRTSLIKLKEFMRDDEEAVQQMAVNTWLKIFEKTGKRLNTKTKNGETLLDEQIRELHPLKLDQLKMCTLFEAFGVAINAGDGEKQGLIQRLLQPYTERFTQAFRYTTEQEVLGDEEKLKTISLILRLNERVARRVGIAYKSQFKNLYPQLLQLYSFAGKRIKRDILRLFISYLDQAFLDGIQLADQQAMAREVIPPLLLPVINAYSSCPQKDPMVLDLIATIIMCLPAAMEREISQIFSSLIGNTFEMVKSDQDLYPEHMVKMFKVVLKIAEYTPTAFLNEQLAECYLQVVLFGIKTRHPKVAQTALKALDIFAVTLHNPVRFHKFWIIVVLELLDLFTALMHNSLLEQQQALLFKLFQAGKDKEEAKIAVIQGLQSRFPLPLVTEFVNGLFAKLHDQNVFDIHLQDFLILSKETTLENLQTIAAYTQRRVEESTSTVPGLAPQYEKREMFIDEEDL